MASPPPLFRRYPALAGALPRAPLGRFPTPVHALRVDERVELWVKRDDLSSAIYGGNKVRKLEFLLGHARAAGARRLLTLGAAGSHHCLATALFGRELGFAVTLVLFPQPRTDHVRRVLRLDLAAGADIRWARHMLLVPAALALARAALRGEALREIPPGGSDARGTLGYVDAALELADQVAAGTAPEPATIVVPGGTLGTAAGLAIGLELAGLRSRVVATRVVAAAVTNRRRLAALVADTLALLRAAGLAHAPEPARVLERLELEPAFLGRGYGHATAAGTAAARRFAAAGLYLEPTYTAKAAACLLERRAAPEGPVLFWHTFSGVEPLITGDVAARLPAAAERYLRG